jgi:uncharacterized membrane protein
MSYKRPKMGNLDAFALQASFTCVPKMGIGYAPRMSITPRLQSAPLDQYWRNQTLVCLCRPTGRRSRGSKAVRLSLLVAEDEEGWLSAAGGSAHYESDRAERQRRRLPGIDWLRKTERQHTMGGDEQNAFNPAPDPSIDPSIDLASLGCTCGRGFWSRVCTTSSIPCTIRLMNSSIIPAANPLLVWLALSLIAIVGLLIDRTPVARMLPGVVVSILLAMVLATLDVLPAPAEVAGFKTLMSLLLALAVPLLLLKVHVGRVIIEAGRMALVFATAIVGSVLGGLVAFFTLPLGDNASGLSSGMTAATIGGSPNFLAVAQVTGILSDPRLAAIGGAALLSAVLYMMLLAILPEIKPLRRLYPIHHSASDQDAAITAMPKLRAITWGPLLVAVTLAALLGGISIATTKAIGQPQWALLLVTALSLVLAWLGHDRFIQMRGEFTLGLFAMYLVFCANGMGADLGLLANASWGIFGLGLVVIAVHFVVVMVLGWLFRFDLAEIVTASNAAVLAPPTAAALAAAKGWTGLIAPATMVGMLGYAAGTFIGAALAGLLAGL